MVMSLRLQEMSAGEEVLRQISVAQTIHHPFLRTENSNKDADAVRVRALDEGASRRN